MLAKQQPTSVAVCDATVITSVQISIYLQSADNLFDYLFGRLMTPPPTTLRRRDSPVKAKQLQHAHYKQSRNGWAEQMQATSGQRGRYLYPPRLLCSLVSLATRTTRYKGCNQWFDAIAPRSVCHRRIGTALAPPQPSSNILAIMD